MSQAYPWDKQAPNPEWGAAFQPDESSTLLAVANTPNDENAAVRGHPVGDRFDALATQWRAETGDLSSTTKRILHPAYQQIIGLGPTAVPVLLRELEHRPDHWFHALRAITSADPVRPEQRGDLDAMAGAWVEWGRSQGYLVACNN